jgi:hypothetical protein
MPQPSILGETQHVIRAAFARYFARAIGRTIVYDQHLYSVDTRHLTRYITDGRRQRLFLIQAGYLHDQFQIIFCSLSGLGSIGLRADRPDRMPDSFPEATNYFGLSAPAPVLSFRRHLSMMRPSL